MIVLDTSAVVEFLFGTDRGAEVAKIIGAEAYSICAPELLVVEFLQVLRRYVRLGELSMDRANDAIVDFREMPIHFYTHGALTERIWNLRDNFTAYDATFIALAEALGATLVTTDNALFTPKIHRAKVIKL